MFMKFSEFGELATPAFDVCIVGAGAAGIALARYLGSKNLAVCLVESGGFEFENETQLLYEGEISGIDYLPLESVRLRYFGGTTNHWQGQSIPLSALDFEKRNWVENSGWPIRFEDFLRFLPQAQEICKLGSDSFDPAFWLAIDGMAGYPLSQSKFDPVFLRYPVPIPRFGKIYRSDIERSDNVTCLLHANVTNIIANERNDHIEAVEIRKFGNITKKVRARYFVLATGAIENCRLLLTSGDIDAGGLANANDVVGRYFMEHPNYDSGVIVLADRRATEYLARPFLLYKSAKLRRDIRLNDAEQQRSEILNHSAFLIPQKKIRQDGKNPLILSQIWAKAEKLRTKDDLPDTFTLRIRLEHAPRAHSRVMLSQTTDVFGIPHAQVRLQAGDLETRTVDAVNRIFAQELGAAGLGRMKIEFDKAKSDLWGNVGWQNHHLGGTRMGTNPRTSVVDPDCRHHGIDNLYVAGSSVFPTSGHANPTMNLLALTFSLGEHLLRRISP